MQVRTTSVGMSRDRGLRSPTNASRRAEKLSFGWVTPGGYSPIQLGVETAMNNSGFAGGGLGSKGDSGGSAGGGGGAEPIFAIVEPACAVFRRTLKAEGLKYTPERAQVLDAVLRYEGLFEAERVIEDVKRRGFRVSKATVYRTLKLLQDAKIIERVITAMPVEGKNLPKAAKGRGGERAGASVGEKANVDNRLEGRFRLVHGHSSAGNTQDVLVRVDTGEVIPLSLPEVEALRDAICRAHGLIPQGHRLQVFAVGG